jgi:hypothetical protein
MIGAVSIPPRPHATTAGLGPLSSVAAGSP